MALLVTLKGERSSVVCKDEFEDVRKELKEMEVKKLGDATLQTFIIFTGWHGKKLMIMEPFDNIITIVEEGNKVVEKQQKLAEAKREIMEKKQREEIQKAGGRIEPIHLFPNKKKH